MAFILLNGRLSCKPLPNNRLKTASRERAQTIAALECCERRVSVGASFRRILEIVVATNWWPWHGAVTHPQSPHMRYPKKASRTPRREKGPALHHQTEPIDLDSPTDASVPLGATTGGR
jgi:hypothetical protein